MNENEFDIHVREILQDAEENVSPRVWEGVVAGLDKPRRVVPVRVWRWVGSVAAAAAVAAGFVFLGPKEKDSNNNPTIFTTAETSLATVTQPENTTSPAEEAPVLSNNNSAVARRVSTSAAPQKAVELLPVSRHESIALVSASAPFGSLVDVPRPQPLSRPLPVRPSFTEEEERLLALPDQDNSFTGGSLSMLLSGNMQTIQRGHMTASTIPVHHGAPELPTAEGIYNTSPEISFGLPVTAGLSLQWDITPRWSLATGIRYSNLSRTFIGDYVGTGFMVPQTDIDNTQHWLGIPLNLSFHIVNTHSWRVSVQGSGVGEYLLDNDFLIHNTPKDIHYHQKGGPLQWSAGLGLGVEYRLSPLVGIYLDPGFRYYFATDRQPRSLRTIQPLRFDLEAGIRFSFGAK